MSIEQCEKQLQEKQTEIRCSETARQQNQTKISNLLSKIKDFEVEIHHRDIQIDTLDKLNAGRTKEFEIMSEQHRQQLRMNQDLMRRKEYVEWELMELRAKQKSLPALTEPKSIPCYASSMTSSCIVDTRQ